MEFNIYLSDGGDNRGRTKSKRIINHIENYNTRITYGERDFLADGSALDNKRKAVRMADFIIIVFTDKFLESPEYMYDAALAICYDRKSLLIDCRKKKDIPPLLRSLPKLCGRKHFDKVLLKLSSKIEEYITQAGAAGSKRKDEALEYIRALEREESLQHEISLHNRLKSVQQELSSANHDMKIARHMYMIEGETISSNLEFQFGEKNKLQRQLRQITDKYRALKRSFHLLQNTLHTSTAHGYENCSSDENSTDNIDHGMKTRSIEDHINKIYMLVLNLNNKVTKNNTEQPDAQMMPSELKSFCKKYTKMIGPNIRHFGRTLDLTTEELDVVEEYRKHGYEEMFWQTVKFWHPKARMHGTFVSLLNALEDIGVDIGGKPMSKLQVLYLHEKIPFLLDHIYRISDLVPYLLSSHTLTETTQMYVSEAQTEEDKLLRLVNVLATRSNGISALCDALDATKQSFIVTEIKKTMPCTSHGLSAIECSDYSSDSTYISDDSNRQVAIVAPTAHNISRPATENSFSQIVQDHVDALETTARGFDLQYEMKGLPKESYKCIDKTKSSGHTWKSVNNCSIQ